MLDRDGLVVHSVIQKNWNALRQTVRQVRALIDIVAGPSALADEWRGDQNDCRRGDRRALIRQRMEKNGRADRVSHDGCSILPKAEFAQQFGLSDGIDGIGFAGHSEIVNGEARPKFALEAFDQLRIPSIMNVFARTLNEEYLRGHDPM